MEAYAKVFLQRYQELTDLEGVIWAIKERRRKAGTCNSIEQDFETQKCQNVRAQGGVSNLVLFEREKIFENCPNFFLKSGFFCRMDGGK